jgi:hypothetical protein
MQSAAATRGKIPATLIGAGVLVLIGLIAGLVYLRTPVQVKPANGAASAEARAYLSHLALSEVNMHASLNFMQQQVVEIEGKILNNGPRPVESVAVYCLFRDVNGREIYRERTQIVQAKGPPFKPGETRSFRLAFDRLPDGWNQTMPTLVIAQITFSR